MSNPDDTKPPDDKWFNQDVPKPFTANRRKSTRYIRNDIGVTVRQIGLLNFSVFKKSDLSVKPLDISSRGVLVTTSTNMNLSINSKVLVIIRFRDFTEFEVLSTVVRKSGEDVQIYGIKFDRVRNSLANYLLKTQKRLTFK
jgi:PilZ domain